MPSQSKSWWASLVLGCTSQQHPSSKKTWVTKPPFLSRNFRKFIQKKIFTCGWKLKTWINDYHLPGWWEVQFNCITILANNNFWKAYLSQWRSRQLTDQIQIFKSTKLLIFTLWAKVLKVQFHQFFLTVVDKSVANFWHCCIIAFGICQLKENKQNSHRLRQILVFLNLFYGKVNGYPRPLVNFKSAFMLETRKHTMLID